MNSCHRMLQKLNTFSTLFIITNRDNFCQIFFFPTLPWFLINWIKLALFFHTRLISSVCAYIFFGKTKVVPRTRFRIIFIFPCIFSVIFSLFLHRKRGTNLMHVIQIKRRSIRITILDYFLEKSPTSKLYKNSILSSTQFLFHTFHVPAITRFSIGVHFRKSIM